MKQTPLYIDVLSAVIGLCILCATVSGSAAQSQLPKDVLDRVKSATAYIVTTITGQRETVTGSGFFLTADGALLTNAHVIRDFLNYSASGQAKLEVIVFTGPEEARILSATVLYYALDQDKLVDGSVNRFNDLALLQADASQPVTYLEFAPTGNLAETQQIYAAGYPLGIPEICIREGSISALRHDMTGSLAYIEHTAGLDSGNSGGPLINTAGNVIGINAWKGGAYANTAIINEVIQGFLDSSGQRYATATGDSQLSSGATGGTSPTAAPVSANQAYREVLAWALAPGETDLTTYIDVHSPEFDSLYARIEKSAYNHGIVPEFALAVLAAETVYGDGISWARRSSWDYYSALSGSEPEYPAAFDDLDTVMDELAQILPEFDSLDQVLAYYWCGPDGDNLDSLYSFKTAVTKLWDSLERFASDR